MRSLRRSRRTEPFIATRERPTVSISRRYATHLAVFALLLGVAGLTPAMAQAEPKPVWSTRISSSPTNLVPGGTPYGEIPLDSFLFVAINAGGASTVGPLTITDTLPVGLTPKRVEAGDATEIGGPNEWGCEIDGQEVTCTTHSATPEVPPGNEVFMFVFVAPDPSLPDPSSFVNQATISGGGAPVAEASQTATVSATPSPFGFVPGPNGLSGSVSDEEGLPATQAGSHPYQASVQLGFSHWPGVGDPENAGAFSWIGAEGGVRDTRTYLPPGMIVNPNASPKLCSEAQLETNTCPPESVVGAITISTVETFTPSASPSVLHNLQPPTGAAASFSFNVAGVGIYPHILGGVRAGSYALGAVANDVLARAQNPLFGAHVELWGDPSSSSHDFARGECVYGANGNPSDCGVEPQTTPLLTMPSFCTPSMQIEAATDSWSNPGIFHERSALMTDDDGNPTPVTGCDDPELKFNPTLQARPTTDVADSPSGLDARLHIPQREELGTLSTPHLRRAVVTLPDGLVINPSSANGLAGCSSAQIGIDPRTGIANGDRPSCPNASRIGDVEVDTQLVTHPLLGSVYVAAPHDNPFDALLAIYVVVDDPASGVLVKLSGHVIADPQTGRLSAVFDDNPQLPFEDFKLRFFGGPAAPLRTPATCGTYSTTSQMTPWTAPESGAAPTPKDTYAINKAPDGGTCASTPADLPDASDFDAGSVSLIAGRYTPFVLNLRRKDGTQQFSAITMSPPPGLLGKLAGTPYCPEAALAAAAANSGNLEKSRPSCPAASQVGTVEVGAGAGPAPYYASGRVYLAGPYKGAPVSLAIVTPAAAGPYDLGTVVVRTALNVDPETTRITAVSDPIPQILQGIPLDVRSIALKLDKPEFTLNPTSCDPFTVSGQLLSGLGQVRPLSNPFQVAECARLPFKPKLSLRLEGGTRRSDHPALKAVLSFPKGASANIARASVALPHSEFLDQAHIGTVCTRVQFAASACPSGSVYGFARAVTPLLERRLQGPVYLRSSSNPLPDLVADLNGQIHVVLDGRIDSVRGGIRNTFEAVPDAPVSKFVLELKGGKKGLLVNSRNLCKSTNRATALFDAQNGKTADSHPVLKNDCRTKAKKRKHKKHRG
jgi:hypothetical protein